MRKQILILLLFWVTTGCALLGQASPSPTPSSTPAAVLPSLAASPTPLVISATPARPGITPTLTLSATATASPTPIPSATPVHPDTIALKIFLIALEDNGASGKLVGCNDSVVPVNIVVPYTTGVLRAALEKLLSIREPYYGMSGLYDALYQSDLSIQSLSVANGLAEIRLKGTLMLGGVCDNPRVQAQLEEIALQFSTVQRVEVYINDKPLNEVLSLK